MLSERGGWGQSTNRPGRHNKHFSAMCVCCNQWKSKRTLKESEQGGKELPTQKFLIFIKLLKVNPTLNFCFSLFTFGFTFGEIPTPHITPLARWRNWKWRRYGPFGGNGRNGRSHAKLTTYTYLGLPQNLLVKIANKTLASLCIIAQKNSPPPSLI